MEKDLFGVGRWTCLVALSLLVAACGGGQGNEDRGGAVIAVNASGGEPASSGAACDRGDASDPDDPCIVTTVDQLQAIIDDPSGHYALGADIDASATAAWNDGEGFEPIHSFAGTFDGRGHTIGGLSIDRPNDGNVGLFAYTEEGSDIRDVGLVDARITADGPAGILAGMNRGSVSRVHANGEIQGGDRVGGLVGTLAPEGTVSDSYTTGSVNATGERIGGLVGQNDGTIRSSFSSSSVHGRTAVGGLVGRSAGTIETSYSVVGSPETPDHKVTGSTSGSHVGGLVGVIESSARIGESYAVSFSSTGRFDFVGHRLVAHDWGDGSGVSSSYWGTDQTPAPRSSLGEPKKIAELRQAATYEGWDFDAVWSIDEGEDYPDLRSNPRP